MTSCLITSPTGGFGNHLRWLLLIDPKFDVLELTKNYKQELIDRYVAVAGQDWPNFDDLTVNNLPSDIHDYFNVQDLIDLKKVRTTTNTIEFIEECVYPQSRTWHNWLIIESNFRYYLDKHIKLIHEGKFSQHDKIISVTINPELALKCYLKFNSALNNLNHHVFKLITKTENNNAVNSQLLEPKKILLIDGEVLYNETLDRDLYNSVIKWFGLSDQYNIAKDIHKIWYNLHLKAEQELIRDLSKVYYT